MAKKFGDRALNSTNYVEETITKALEESVSPQPAVVQPVSTAPAEEEIPTTTKAEVPTVVEVPAKKSRGGEGRTKSSSKKSSGKDVKPEEKTIGMNLSIPKSTYKRLSNMKFDMDGETLKSLGLMAIEEFLKKNGY